MPLTPHLTSATARAKTAAVAAADKSLTQKISCGQLQRDFTYQIFTVHPHHDGGASAASYAAWLLPHAGIRAPLRERRAESVNFLPDLLLLRRCSLTHERFETVVGSLELLFCGMQTLHHCARACLQLGGRLMDTTQEQTAILQKLMHAMADFLGVVPLLRINLAADNVHQHMRCDKIGQHDNDDAVRQKGEAKTAKDLQSGRNTRGQSTAQLPRWLMPNRIRLPIHTRPFRFIGFWL